MKKIIAFGDIHGVAKVTERAILLAEELKAQAIFLGDYVDRGKESLLVIEMLIQAKAKHPDWIFLMGNHDMMFLDLINGKENKGGYDDRTKKDAYAPWLLLDSEDQRSITTFLEQLTFYYETPEFIFLHAPLKETGENLAQKNNDELIWNYDYEPIWQGKKFIHGHYPVDDVVEKYNGININTSCGYGWGYLTGCVVEENQQIVHAYIKINNEGVVF